MYQEMFPDSETAKVTELFLAGARIICKVNCFFVLEFDGEGENKIHAEK